MESAQIVMPLIRGVLHKKLEELVLQAMDDPENLPFEWDDSIDIAKKEGFSDILDGMKEVHSEIGEIQARRNIKRAKENREKDLKEERMNEYFSASNGMMLPILEDGLEFVLSERDVKSGRIDIHAKGGKGEDVIIELKARPYEPKVAIQLLKYLHDDTLKDTRVIFAAPEIKADYFFAFKNFVEQGRTKFLELKEVADDIYVFGKELTAEDFMFNPNSRKWIRKNTKNNGRVRVTSKVSQDGNGRMRNKLAADDIPEDSQTRIEIIDDGKDVLVVGSLSEKEYNQIVERSIRVLDDSELGFDVLEERELSKEEVDKLRRETIKLGSFIELGTFHGRDIPEEWYKLPYLKRLSMISGVGTKEALVERGLALIVGKIRPEFPEIDAGRKISVARRDYETLFSLSSDAPALEGQIASRENAEPFIRNKSIIKIMRKTRSLANRMYAAEDGLSGLTHSFTTLMGPLSEKGTKIAGSTITGDRVLNVDDSLENRLMMMEIYCRLFGKKASELFDSATYKLFTRVLRKARRDLPANDTDLGCLERDYRAMNRDGVEAIAEMFHNKISRTRALLGVNSNLAELYFAHNLNISKFLSRDISEDGAKIDSDGDFRVYVKSDEIDNHVLREFMHWDNALYDQILDLFEPIPEEKPSQLEAKVVESPQISLPEESKSVRAVSNNGKQEVKQKVYSIKDLTNGMKLHHPSEDVKLCVQYFVDEVLNNRAYSAHLRERLGYLTAHSGWVDRGLSDGQVLNFFGDLRVYAAQGKVPNKTEMKVLLDKA